MATGRETEDPESCALSMDGKSPPGPGRPGGSPPSPLQDWLCPGQPPFRPEGCGPWWEARLPSSPARRLPSPGSGRLVCKPGVVDARLHPTQMPDGPGRGSLSPPPTPGVCHLQAGGAWSAGALSPGGDLGSGLRLSESQHVGGGGGG